MVVETVRSPGAGGAVQLTVKAVVPKTPATTVTVRGLSPPTEQFPATPESATR